MDGTLFPGSWGLVKRNIPGLVGAGIGAIAGSIAAGRKAYQQQQIDAREKFVTWKGQRKMPAMKSRRVAGRRMRRPMYRRPIKPRGEGPWKRLVRSSATGTFTVTAATSTYGVISPALQSVQTSDLTAAYKLYRIRKVVIHLVPRVDSANSGLANNFQARIALANDPEDTTNPTTHQQITAYDNSYEKFVVSGDKLRYTFYPKVVNAVGNAGATAYVGSYGFNPWLQLNASGISIPHNCLKYGIDVVGSTTVNFSYYLEYHFDVKGLA